MVTLASHGPVTVPLMTQLFVQFAVTVKGVPLLGTPATFTITLPVVAPAGTGATMLVSLQVVTAAVVPLKVTVLPVTWLPPKFVPVIVTGVPTAPVVGLRLGMTGAGVTVNVSVLLACAPTVTTTLPVVAPLGTVTVMLAALQELAAAAAMPLNVTVLPPCDVPKLLPAMVMDAPIGPEFGVRVLRTGATVKLNPLLGTPATVTMTLPVIAPTGTGTTMLVALQLVTGAVVPPKLTMLPVTCDAPKFVPVMVIEVPTAPEVWLRSVICGAAVTVKGEPALATPAALTTTLPVVAPAGTVTAMLVGVQVPTVADMPLKVTVLPATCVAPKFVPAITTDAPIAPAFGVRLVMAGAGVTVKGTPLLDTPAVFTTTEPVVAPIGTVTVMLFAPQVVTDAAVLPNVTVPVPCDAPKLVPAMMTVAPTAPELGAKL